MCDWVNEKLNVKSICRSWNKVYNVLYEDEKSNYFSCVNPDIFLLKQM